MKLGGGWARVIGAHILGALGNSGQRVRTPPHTPPSLPSFKSAYPPFLSFPRTCPPLLPHPVSTSGLSGLSGCAVCLGVSPHPTPALTQALPIPSTPSPAFLPRGRKKDRFLQQPTPSWLWVTQQPAHSFLKQGLWAVTKFKFWASKQECQGFLNF